LALSAAQSQLFNLLLSERIADRSVAKVQAGDVMQVLETGGPFVAEDVETEQRRCDAGDTVITGPLFGPKMKQPTGEPALREANVLASLGIALEDFDRFPNLTSGVRRPYLARFGDFSVTGEPNGLQFRFTLPSGCYATMLLREFLKQDVG
jgi:tRNA pseudouridine13 synthase